MNSLIEICLNSFYIDYYDCLNKKIFLKISRLTMNSHADIFTVYALFVFFTLFKNQLRICLCFYTFTFMSGQSHLYTTQRYVQNRFFSRQISIICLSKASVWLSLYIYRDRSLLYKKNILYSKNCFVLLFSCMIDSLLFASLFISNSNCNYLYNDIKRFYNF